LNTRRRCREVLRCPGLWSGNGILVTGLLALGILHGNRVG
jgi:hypothetical protein